MARLGKNVRKRKDGRWEARLYLGKKADNRADIISFYGHSAKEAENKRKNYLLEHSSVNEMINRKGFQNQDILFGQVAEEWLQSASHRVKLTTYHTYAAIVEKHLLPSWSTIKLSAMTTEKLNCFLIEKGISGRLDGKGGLSGKSVSDIRIVLNSIIKYAITMDYPCRATKPLTPIKHTDKKIRVLSKKEQSQLESYMDENLDRDALPVMLALYTGIRLGEACALTWKDIDFDSRTIRINKSLARVKNTDKNAATKTKMVILSPKSEKSIRSLQIPGLLLPVLKAAAGKEDTYVITGTKKYMDPRVLEEHFKKLLAHAGIGKTNFHVLRHTYATRAVENGINEKALCENMGHHDVSVTMKYYVHPTDEYKQVFADSIARITLCGQNCSTFHVENAVF